MKFAAIIGAVVLVLGAWFPVRGADEGIHGSWQIVFEGGNRAAPPWTMTVKEEKGQLSGTLSLDWGRLPLVAPKLEAGAFRFQIVAGFTKASVEVKLVGGRLNGTWTNGRTQGLVRATRQETSVPAALPYSREKTIVTAQNPDPSRLPTLAVWEEQFPNPLDGGFNFVSSRFPNAPDFICDAWCYESRVDFLGAAALEGGRVELRHRVQEFPQVIIVTTATPEAGGVEILARIELDKDRGGNLPDSIVRPNLCWQLRRAPGFASKPDPYPEFVKRCFVFTERGRTFLDHTTRRKIPIEPAGSPRNNPPWIQVYGAVGAPVPEETATSGSGVSPDRYTIPVIGVVSRDGRHLAALASDSATSMSQVWVDCLHNNPPWQPAAAPHAERTWRVKIYVLENDPEALLARVARDFPRAR